jgi:hypothetical protein
MSNPYAKDILRSILSSNALVNRQKDYYITHGPGVWVMMLRDLSIGIYLEPSTWAEYIPMKKVMNTSTMITQEVYDTFDPHKNMYAIVYVPRSYYSMSRSL